MVLSQTCFCQEFFFPIKRRNWEVKAGDRLNFGAETRVKCPILVEYGTYGQTLQWLNVLYSNPTDTRSITLTIKPTGCTSFWNLFLE